MPTTLVRPDIIFEANFFNTQDGQAWTDLSSYVELDRGIDVSMRRQVVFDDVSAGSFSITLDNSTGVFNNARADQPYFGLLNVDVPVRFRVRWPRVPTDTVNMLSSDEATAASPDAFNAEQGSLDLETVSVPGGQTTALIWNTGVLQTLDNRVQIGDFPSRSADDFPVYVKPSTQYTFSASFKDDAAGTGITFQIAPAIQWYDKTGAFISESIGTSTTLTTSYVRLSVTATSPATAYTARMGMNNKTLVNPAASAITVTGYTDDAVNKGGRFTHLRIPPEANVGDLAVAFHYVNAQPTISTPTGWTQLTVFNDSRGRCQVAWKILTQKDINTVVEWNINQTGKKWLAFLGTYSGINQASPINVSATATESTYQTGHSTPAVTTTVANCWIVHGVFDTSTTNTAWTPGAGYTLRTARYCIGGNAATGILADSNGPKALGAQAGVSYSSTSASKAASMATVAIAPATSTGPGSVTVWMGALQFEQAASASAWTAAGTWLNLFTGFVDSWHKTFEDTLSFMQVAATDKSKQLASINVGSAVFETVKLSSPVAYYVLGESGDSATTQGANSALTSQGTMTPSQVGSGGTLSWGSGIGPAVDGTAAVQITKLDINNGLTLQAKLTNPIHNSSALSIMCWFKTTDTDTSGTLTLLKATPTNAGGVEMAYAELKGSSGTNMMASGSVKSANISTTVTATDAHNYFDGKTHLAVATFELTNGQLISTLFIDGAQTAQNSAATSLTEFPAITLMNVARAYPNKNICSGTYSHVALFDYILDADTISGIYDAGSTAFAGDSVDERIGRICTWAGISNMDLDPSDITCDRHLPDTKSAQDLLRIAAKTDGGSVFINGSGQVEFKSRLGKESTYTTWLNVDTRYVQPSLAEVTDDQLLVNQAVVSQVSTGASATSYDLDSQAVHGVYEKPSDSLTKDIQEAQNQADYLTAFYGVPTQRCDNVVIEATFLNNWPVLVTQDMWNIIHITSMPSIEASSVLDLYVEGWQWQITDESVTITYDTSTAIPFAVLNDSARGVVGNVVVAW